MGGIGKIGDPFTCGDTIASGSGDVFANGIPVAMMGSATIGHPCGPPTTIGNGATTVFVNGMPAAVMGISTIVPHGTCDGPPHPGTLVDLPGNINVE